MEKVIHQQVQHHYQQTSDELFQSVVRPGETVLSCIQRVSSLGVLVEARSLYMALMTSLNDLKEGIVLQYRVAKQQRKHDWVREIRSSCQCDLPDNWIEENIPSLDGKKLTKKPQRRLRGQRMLPDPRATYVSSMIQRCRCTEQTLQMILRWTQLLVKGPRMG